MNTSLGNSTIQATTLPLLSPHFPMMRAIHLFDRNQETSLQIANQLSEVAAPVRWYRHPLELQEAFSIGSRGVAVIHQQNNMLMDGLDLSNCQSQCRMPFIILLDSPSIEMTVAAMQQGAAMVLAYPPQRDALLKAVQHAMEEDDRKFQHWSRQQTNRQRLDNLTSKEREVLRLMLQGLPNKAIAKRLNVSQRTVELRRQMIYQKTGTGSLVELLRLVLTDDQEICVEAEAASIE